MTVSRCLVTTAVTHVTRVEAFEVVGRRVIGSVAWQGAVVAEVRVKRVIHRPMKACGTMDPGAGAKENATIEPLGTVVAVGSAVVRSVVEIAVRTSRSRAANVHAY